MSRRTRQLFKELFRLHKIHKLLVVGGLLVLLSAWTVPMFERAYPEANIKTFGDGLWWAIVTVTSTGYGDLVPVSAGGKFIGTILMISGIALFSTAVALIASFYAHRRYMRDTKRVDQELDGITTKLEEVNKKMEFLVKKN